jgi:hypothetical protein
MSDFVKLLLVDTELIEYHHLLHYWRPLQAYGRAYIYCSVFCFVQFVFTNYKDLRTVCSVSGGLRHVYVPNNTLFGFDAMDVKNCYACYDNVKHPEGSNTYQAGHMGHYGYDYQ